MPIIGQYLIRGEIKIEAAYLKITDISGGEGYGWHGFAEVYISKDGSELNPIDRVPINCPYVIGEDPTSLLEQAAMKSYLFKDFNPE